MDTAPKARNLARGALTDWRIDPDLAGLREPGALRRLSAGGRKECLAPWEEVAAVLGRAQTTR